MMTVATVEISTTFFSPTANYSNTLYIYMKKLNSGARCQLIINCTSW